MSLFDHVKVVDGRCACPKGHNMSGLDFQTKDLGMTMGEATIAKGRFTFTPGNYGEPVRIPFLGRIEIYTECTHCPVYVQDVTFNIFHTWCIFSVEIVDDRIRNIMALKDPDPQPLFNCQGPMSLDDAKKLVKEHWAVLNRKDDRK